VIRTAPFDIAFIAVKSYDTVWATELIKPYLTDTGYVVTVQNGMNEERVASVMGWGKTVGCVCGVHAVELIGPGSIQRNNALAKKDYPSLRIGEVHGSITPRVNELVEMLDCCDTAVATQNLWGERWSKLCVNAMRNPVAAATGVAANANDLDPQVRSLNIRIAAEAVQVGRALGYTLVQIYRMEPDLILSAGSGDKAAYAECERILLDLAKFRGAAQRPSMAQDLLKQRRTEIDLLNGLVVAKGKEVGIETPVNQKIIEMIRRIERGHAQPHPDLIAGL
jgi:2-dehydropantoate 2-reductase